MPNSQSSKRNVFKRNCRAGKKVRERYEKAIARDLAISNSNTVIVAGLEIKVGESFLTNPPAEIISKNSNQNFDELLQSMEEFLNSDL